MNVKKIAIVIFVVLIGISFIIFLLTKNSDYNNNNVAKISPTQQANSNSQQNQNSNINNNNSNSQVQKDGKGILLNEVPESDTVVELTCEVVKAKTYLDGSKIQYILTVITTYENIEYKCDIEVAKNIYSKALINGEIKAMIAIIRVGGRVFVSFEEIF